MPELALEPSRLAHALAVLTLQAGYNSAVVVLGATALGVAAGVVGTFTFLRKRALISDALSHATLPGIALAYLAGVLLGLETRNLPLLLAGAALTGIVGVFLVQLLTRHTRLTEDAAIGAVLSVLFGLGVVLMSYVQALDTGGQAGIKTFILGQAAAMTRQEAVALAVLALLAVLATILLFKEFQLVCFDADFAQGLGRPVFRIDLLMAGLTVFVTVIGLQTVGLILIIALLIVPPVAARFWSNRLPRILVLSGAIGGASAWLGASLSAILPDLPTGGVIVLVAGLFFLVSLLFAPARGVIAAALRLTWHRLRLAEVKALTALLSAERTGGAIELPPALAVWLALRGLVSQSGRRLSPRARPRAIAACRNLRLWEQALDAGITDLPGHAFWGVDPIDRVLPRDVVAALERELVRTQTAAPKGAT